MNDVSCLFELQVINFKGYFGDSEFLVCLVSLCKPPKSLAKPQALPMVKNFSILFNFSFLCASIIGAIPIKSKQSNVTQRKNYKRDLWSLNLAIRKTTWLKFIFCLIVAFRGAWKPIVSQFYLRNFKLKMFSRIQRQDVMYDVEHIGKL